MPIPSNYRDICEMLIKASDAGRVNWLEEGDTHVVRLPDYNLNLWSGEEEGRSFIALGLKTPGQKGLIDSWYVDEAEEDFEVLHRLLGAARHSSSRVAQKLDELRKLLQGDGKIGLDDTEAVTAEGGIPGWTTVGNWEVREEQIANWEHGSDRIRGKHRGTALWREHLPSTCTVKFEACLLQNRGGDEIDVIVGDSMVLYYSAGVRLDYMTNDVGQMGKDIKRDPNKKLVPFEKPQVARWYVFKIIKTSEKATLLIDDKQAMDITWGPRTPFRERLGFHHWNDEVEFRNLRVEET